MRWIVAAVLALALVIPFGSGIPVTRANGSTVVTYDFIANAANAEWNGWEPSTSYPLTFGVQSFTQGFAVSFSGDLEAGGPVNNALETYPPTKAPGGITGDYRHIYIPENATLKVEFAFKQGANATDGVEVGVAFTEDKPSMPVFDLFRRNKTYDQSIMAAEYDLGPFGSKVGNFQLFVRSGASATADALVWTAAVITIPTPLAGQPAVVTYDFMNEAYNAEWFGWQAGSSQPLAFGAPASALGYAGVYDGALEDGKNYTNALQTIPPSSANSGLTGEYRNLYIPSHAQLRFIFGFQKGVNATDGVEAGVGCFQAGVADFEQVVSKVYDNALKEEVADLSSYADIFAGFQMFVRAGASANADALVWVRAVIEVVPDTPSVVPIVLHFFVGSQTYYVDSLAKQMDTQPMIVESRTFLPIRYVAQELGAVVDWYAPDQKVTITLQGKKIELWIGKNSAAVNGAYSLIDPANPNVVPFIQPPGRTMMPLRFISENLGAKVEWFPPTEARVTWPAP
ncbi:MAG: copper amine oxidase N-terminal domain-containing protein [Coprothermobacterota bacterium]|nr:copper amine oxidase N-terminal domain-containing protein [Coprothermobacterota bacterium]